MSRLGDTTESERIPHRVMPRVPGLRLLFSAETIVPNPPFYPLRLGEHAIGRVVEPGRGVGLPDDRRASRIHALVRVSGSATPIEIHDADSKNGIYVNGLRCQHCVLKDGDILRIGDSLLLLRYEQTDLSDAPIAALLGISAGQKALRARIRSVAASDAAVLLLGESGTGKDLSARAIHSASGRRGPLVSVNCAAIPDSLAESQFFGHMAGSFTGAQKDRQGFFAAADQGTLFLDEIGELSPRGQALLLRAIEDHAITPIGATAPRSCDVRIVAATNRDLPHAVEQGSFRGDLYARLAALVLRLLPLRARAEDVLILLSSALGPRPPQMTARLAEALLLYAFPFNVRELHQLAKDLLSSGETLLDLPLIAERLAVATPHRSSTSSSSPSTAISESDLPLPKQPLSREVLLRLLEEHHGIIARVAQAAGRSRRQVMRWLDQYQLDAEKFRR